MFDSHQKHTGTQHTRTVALLLVAFVVSPVVFFGTRPMENVSAILAIGCSALCATFAWVNWKWFSELTIPSIEAPIPRSK